MLEEKVYEGIQNARKKEADIILKTLLVALGFSLLLLPFLLGVLGQIAWTIYFILMFSDLLWAGIEIFKKEEKIFELKEKIKK